MKTFKKVLALLLVAALAAGIAVLGTVAYFTHEDEDINTFTIGNVEVELVELQRDNTENATALETFKDGKQLMPINGSAQGTKDAFGQPVAKNYVDKIVYATNIGDSDAYMRIIVAIPTWANTTDKTPANNNLHWNTANATTNAYLKTMIEAAGGSVSEVGYALSYDMAETVTIDEQTYWLFTFTFNGIVKAGESTQAVMSGLYLDSRVDYNPETGMYEDVLGNAFEIPENTANIPVIVQAIQADGFGTAEAAFAAANFPANPWEASKLPVTVSTIQELAEALAAGEDVTLVGNVTTDENLTVPEGGTFDGNGNTIDGKTSADSGINAVLSVSGGTITNVKVISDPSVESANVARALYVPSVKGDFYVSNSYFKAHYAMNINAKSTEYGFYADNCTFVGWSSYSSIKEAVFTDCTFDGTFVSDYYPATDYSMARVRPYANSTFTGCTFQGDVVLDVTSKDNLTLTFKDCYVDDGEGKLVPLTADNFYKLLASEDNAIPATTTVVFG